MRILCNRPVAPPVRRVRSGPISEQRRVRSVLVGGTAALDGACVAALATSTHSQALAAFNVMQDTLALLTVRVKASATLVSTASLARRHVQSVSPATSALPLVGRSVLRDS